jgi:hypothetical protein
MALSELEPTATRAGVREPFAGPGLGQSFLPFLLLSGHHGHNLGRGTAHAHQHGQRLQGFVDALEERFPSRA